MATCSKCVPVPKPPSQAQTTELKALLRGLEISDTTRVTQLLARAEEDLCQIDKEIGRQHSLLLTLMDYQDAVQKHIDGYKSLLSPIRGLPSEILREVFLFYCEAEGGNRITVNYGPGLGIQIPAFTLSQVCAHWRGIALSTSGLWSRILVDSERARESEELIRELLFRSENTPLSLGLYINEKADSPSLSLLFASAHRSRHLRVHSSLYPLPSSAAVIQNNLPLLEELFLCLHPDDDCAFQLFSTVPKLRTLHLRGITPQRLHHDFPKSQIVSLTAGCFGLRDVTDAVETMPKLESLILEDYDYGPLHATTRAASQLRNLVIMIEDDPGLHLMKYLSLPVLSSLTVSRPLVYTVRSPISLSELSSCLSRSRCALTTLNWYGIPVKSTSWMILFSSLNSLVDLTLCETEGSGTLWPHDFFIHMQRRFSGVKPFLPKLQQLCLTVYQRPLPGRLFYEALASRSLVDEGEPEMACLEYARLELVNEEFDCSSVGLLESLISSGMKIVVQDSTGIVIC